MGVLQSKIPGSRDFFCNLQFSNRVSLVVMVGKAPLSGVMLWILGSALVSHSMIP